jgi:hypothetical protein
VRINEDLRQYAERKTQHLEELIKAKKKETEDQRDKKNSVLKFLEQVSLSVSAAFGARPVYKKGYESKLLYPRWWLQRLTVNSRVVKFFSVLGDHIIEEPDAAISAMALICALVLTIPFSVFTVINDGFLTALRTAIEACPNGVNYYNQSYRTVYIRLVGSPGLTMYASIMGLIISSIYFIFKPSKGKDLDRWCRRQGRLLMTIQFIVCIVAVLALCSTAAQLFSSFNIELANICTADGSSDWIWIPGAAGVAISFILAVIGMW